MTNRFASMDIYLVVHYILLYCSHSVLLYFPHMWILLFYAWRIYWTKTYMKQRMRTLPHSFLFHTLRSSYWYDECFNNWYDVSAISIVFWARCVHVILKIYWREVKKVLLVGVELDLRNRSTPAESLQVYKNSPFTKLINAVFNRLEPETSTDSHSVQGILWHFG